MEYNLMYVRGFWMSERLSPKMNPEAFQRLRELVIGSVVYELGSGYKGGFLPFLRRTAFLRYAGIDPGVTSEEMNRRFGSANVSFSGEDALTYLRGVPAESGVVISSAFMNPQIICSESYLDDLVSQIARVTPTGLSTIHFDIGGFSQWVNPVFTKHGLKPRRLGRTEPVVRAEVFEYVKA